MDPVIISNYRSKKQMFRILHHYYFGRWVNYSTLNFNNHTMTLSHASMCLLVFFLLSLTYEASNTNLIAWYSET